MTGSTFDLDENKFELYFIGSIVPLYPDAKDTKGKLVLVKIDSGPVQLNMNMIVRLRNLGYILYPGMPNTTSATQETYKGYGVFKSHFARTLN